MKCSNWNRRGRRRNGPSPIQISQGSILYRLKPASSTAGCSNIAEDLQARGRKVEYHNTGILFPEARPDRMPYFIDPVHVSDKGNDVLGRFYAERILAHGNGASK